ncbi:MAG: hypothetical protein MJ250_08140 [Alphaproteobacteria bacterium]|nr:hypothetical protein [Alphaproteobacteria bacterium]
MTEKLEKTETKNIELKDEELSKISAGGVKDTDWNIDIRSSKTHKSE